MTSASASAKTILFGEHAVVYGVPALAAPVSALRAYVEAVKGDADSGVHLIAPQMGSALPIAVGLNAETVDDALALTVRLVLKALNVPPPDVTLTLRSDIPIASGMGSGAAVSTAIARALCTFVGKSLDAETLNALVYEVEKLHHGTPSGIDNTVIVYEKPVYFVRGTPPLVLDVGAPIHLLIADTGNPASTRAAVSSVRELYERDRDSVGATFEEIHNIVTTARGHIESGQIASLGALMNRNHALLRALTVSSHELDRLVDAALDAGALGAKLSGGGRGGIMIALVEPNQLEDVYVALQNAGAISVILTEVK